ncbi:MAG: hypothetical protein GY779_10165, partial [Gammaproteobacteria bacterium]|nr:hypothetical protein [Gammaproteobacteria bacterium]
LVITHPDNVCIEEQNSATLYVCVPPALSLSANSGSTCVDEAITVSSNTYGGSATQVTITENGAGSVDQSSISTSPFSFTYTPATGDAGNTVTITVTTDNPDGAPCVAAQETYVLTVNDNVVADDPADAEACDSYTLPALTDGDYFTATGGSGTALSAGDDITTTQTIYVYSAGTGSCPDVENSFVITINNTPLADAPADAEACDTYQLPALTNGNYFTETAGGGTALSAGDDITATQAIYVYSAGTGSCPDVENSFVVTINDTLSIDESTVGPCDDNGTDTDASDDTFEVTVNATAINPGASNQFTVTDGTTTWGPFDSGTGGVIIDLPADGNIISLFFEDVDDDACNATVDVSQLSCSSACAFTIDEATASACNDNGTPADPSDDFFDVNINASAINPGTSGQYTVSDGTNTWGPFDYGNNETISGLPADGSDITLTFSDADDIGCNDAIVVNVASCSDLCILSIDESTVGPCDDNGTDTDASDDTFEVTVNASAINPGASNQFTVTDGTTTWGPFDYGTGGVIIDLPADGNIISLSFADVDDDACNATVDVSQLPCSSACTFAIDEATAGPC